LESTIVLDSNLSRHVGKPQLATPKGNPKCVHHIDFKAGAKKTGVQALQLMLIPGGRIPWIGAPSWERDRDGNLKSAAHDGTADGEFRRRHSPHRNRYDIQVWMYAPTALPTAGKASAHNLGVLSNILANISAPCHPTKVDVEPKWLRGTSTWSSLSLRAFAPDSSAKPLAAWEAFGN
jgi:hypothetical protein